MKHPSGHTSHRIVEKASRASITKRPPRRACAMLMFLALVMPSSMTVPVTEIYTTPGCRYCSRAKGFLKKRGVEYIEKDVGDDASMLNDMIQRAGRATLPQIFIAGEHIGGCSDMLDLHATGSLAARFEAAGITLLDMVDDDPEPPPAAIVPEKQPGRDGGVLNVPIFGQQQQQGTTVATKESGAAAALSNAMQRQMLSLLDEYAKEDGGCDLARLRVSADFAAFLDLAGQLCTLPAAELLGSDAPLDERKAFWINLYNCLVLHSTAVLGAPTDAAERGRYFSGASGAAYNVGGLTFCLNDMSTACSATRLRSAERSCSARTTTGCHSCCHSSTPASLCTQLWCALVPSHQGVLDSSAGGGAQPGDACVPRG